MHLLSSTRLAVCIMDISVLLPTTVPYPHVFVETGGLAEALAAHPALVGPVLLVHV